MQLNNEEDVKIHALPGVLTALGYDPVRIAYNQTITVKQGRQTKSIFADAVVYADTAREVPLVVVETKGPTEQLTDGDRDQAISYARLITPIAPAVLLYNGSAAGTRAYDTFTLARFPGGLPTQEILAGHQMVSAASEDVRNRLVAEAKQETFRFENVEEFKRILRASHNVIRNHEGYDPTKAFDELSKIMFTKLYEERAGKDRFTLAKFDRFMEDGVNIVRQIFDETKKSPKFRGLFLQDSAIELSDRTVRELVKHFERYDLSLTNFDVKGEAFEHFLGDTFTGGLGQYFTPRNVVKFMTDALQPEIGQKVIDPFCGTGGFLIWWHEAVADEIRVSRSSEARKKADLQELGEDCIFGIDWNERTSLACRMNMVVHGEGDSGRNVFKQSGFVDAARKEGTFETIVVHDDAFDVCITNPPFGSSESDPDILSRHDIATGRKSIERAALALERALRLVKPGGLVGIIVMDGILSNSSMRRVREYVRKNSQVLGLISLPPETFEGYGGRSDTTILFLRKKEIPDGGDQDDVFMAVCRHSGYAPTGAEVDGNELPAILDAYRKWQAGKPVSGENVWVGALAERLDPKYYWRAVAPSAELSVTESISGVEHSIAQLVRTATQMRSELDVLTVVIDTKPVTLGELFEEVKDRITAADDEHYKLAGVRWWGGGAFVRETKRGAEIKTSSRLNRLSPGLLIYNRLFAFRGSFAITGDECADAYVSVEFPTYKVREGIEDPDLILRYVVHLLNSPRYLAVVDAQSSGSTKTSRNRFKQEVFKVFTVALPIERGDMLRIVSLLDQLDVLRNQLASVDAGARMLRGALNEMIPTP